ncbi:MAG: RecX family transcriptional regulator [Anaerolineae bacterium]
MAGTITSLVVQKNNKERVNVFIDGEFAFGLALSEALRLRKGQQLTDEEIARLKAFDELEVAHERALHYLSYRQRSTAELRRYLLGKEFSEQAVETVIERLERAGLLDDAAFARLWIESRLQANPRGERALRHELRQKGIPETIIRAALADLDQQEAAYRAAIQRASRYAGSDEATFRKRLGDFLLRRGFDFATARDAVERLWNELKHDENEPDSD